MFTILCCILFALCLVLVFISVLEYDRVPNTKKLFFDGKIQISEAMLFSHFTLARSIKEYFRKNHVNELILTDGVVLKKEDNFDLIKAKLGFWEQTNMTTEDKITNITIGIWNDYGCCRKYRRIFRNVLIEKYYRREIDEQTYTKCLKKFYKYLA